MKEKRAALFEQIHDTYLSKNKQVHLYFISNSNRIMGGELLVNKKPFIVIDQEIRNAFDSINDLIIRLNLNPPYKESWLNSYNRVQHILQSEQHYVSLNLLTSVVFGPYFNPQRSAQSYNVYKTLYFKIGEIENLLDSSLLKNLERVIIGEQVFCTIDQAAISLKLTNKATNKVTQQTPITNEPVETDEIDDFAKLQRIQLTNFLNLNPVDVQFSAGINVIIGENNIGKTGFMKFLYANTKAYEEYGKARGTSNERSFQEKLSIKLQKTFQSDDKIGTLVNKQTTDELSSNIAFNTSDEEERYIQFTIDRSTRTEVAPINFTEIYTEQAVYKYNTVFIPTKEVLSISNAIKVALNYPTDGFDATYEDLLKDIEPLFAKKSDDNLLNDIASRFEKDILDGEIEYNTSRSKYYYKNIAGDRFDLTMTAEGIKQTGIIPLLIRTGKITEGTILFLDEPDNNLNPKAIRKLVKVLFELAHVGVQIFITTHNHLLSQYISLLNAFKVESGNPHIPNSKFFAFYSDANRKTSIESADDLLDLQHNLILDEHLKLSDKEQELIGKSEKK